MRKNLRTILTPVESLRLEASALTYVKNRKYFATVPWDTSDEEGRRQQQARIEKQLIKFALDVLVPCGLISHS